MNDSPMDTGRHRLTAGSPGNEYVSPSIPAPHPPASGAPESPVEASAADASNVPESPVEASAADASNVPASTAAVELEHPFSSAPRRTPETAHMRVVATH